MNFAGFFELHARGNPERMAIADSRRRLSFGELNELSNALANGLVQAGLGKGDRLAICLLNRVELAIALLACFKSGIIAAPLNWRLQGPDLARIVQHAAPSCLLTTQSRRQELKDVGLPLVLEVSDDAASGSFWDLIGRSSRKFDSIGCQAKDIANLLYTSGTTSTPKAAIHTHGMRVAIAGSMADCFKLSRRDKALAISPLFHTGGMSVFANAIFSGCSCYLMEKWDVREFLRIIDAEEITFMHLIATLVVDIASAPPELFKGLKSKVRMVWGGGHNVDVAVLKTFEDRLGGTLLLGYSRTEGGLTYNKLDRAERSFEHNGFQNTNSSEVAIFDAAGEKCPAGTIGEIAVRGDGVTPGYWDNQYVRKPRLIDDSWQPTGDLGYFDPDGALHFIGRNDEMIKTGGENVYPSEVAAALLSVAGISDAAVFGLPDARMGQKVAALLVRSDPALTMEAVDKQVRSLLGGFKIPRAAAFVDELPRLGSQKIDYAACRRLLQTQPEQK